MATAKVYTDEELPPEARAVFDDIRATRGSDFVNNIWRVLAFDPPLLKRTWESVKGVMAVPGEIDPLTREMIYIAVSTANGCDYCVHSHAAAARAKGMTDAQYGELVTIIALASSTNALANALRPPVDPEFEVS